MPILSFGSQNINIIIGKKNMTIRKIWKHPLKVGDRLYCYWNLVSKEKKKIFEAKVTDIQLIKYGQLKTMMNWPVQRDIKMLKRWYMILKRCMSKN